MVKDAYRHPFEYISPMLYYDFKSEKELEFFNSTEKLKN
jgi:hypothetical protein